MKNFIRSIFHRIAVVLSRSAIIAKVSQRIADYRRGNNNPDMATNGEMDFLKKHKGQLNVAFDVGGNKGDWTRSALGINPAMKVVAFEPDPSMFAIFKANNFPSNVTCVNEGLGVTKGRLTLYVNKESPGMNSFVKRGIFHDGDLEKKEATVTTVDAYCAEHAIAKIDFMKIDVEGFELNVLKGAEKMIREKAVSIIQFEYGGTYLDSGISLKNMFDFFSNTEYSLYKLLPRGTMPVVEYSPVLEDFQYSNYVAIAK